MSVILMVSKFSRLKLESLVNFESEFGNFCEQYYSVKAIQVYQWPGQKFTFFNKIRFYIHLVKTSERHTGSVLVGWAGQGSSGLRAAMEFIIYISHTSTQYIDFVDFLHFTGFVYHLFYSFWWVLSFLCV